MSERTIPDRDTIARALFAHHVSDYAAETAPAIMRLCESAADAVLAVLADQPTIAEARAQALNDAADAYDRDAISFKPGGWGSNDADVQTINLAAWSRDWLRARAARERGGSR